MPGCAHCCSVFSLVAGVLLLVFAGIVKDSMTFHIIAAHKHWDLAEKSKTCVIAAVIYFVLSAVCFAAAVVPPWLKARREGPGSPRRAAAQNSWSPTPPTTPNRGASAADAGTSLLSARQESGKRYS